MTLLLAILFGALAMYVVQILWKKRGDRSSSTVTEEINKAKNSARSWSEALTAEEAAKAFEKETK